MNRTESPGATTEQPASAAGNSPPRRHRPFRGSLAHGLALLALVTLVVRNAVQLGPQDGFDAHWYIGYALAERDDSRVFRTSYEIPPLYPAYLSALMNLDPNYERYLECLHENLPYWGDEGNGFGVIRGGKPASCRRIEHSGFALQLLLAALSVVLVWLAGYLASGRPAVAHLAALLVTWSPAWLRLLLRHTPDSLVVPLFAAFHLLLAYLVLAGSRASRWKRTAAAIAAGLLLGALALTRPPYEYLLPALAGAAWLWVIGSRTRRREIAASSALLLASALLVFGLGVLPSGGNEKIGVTATQAPAGLEDRLGFNEMTTRHWVAALVRWSGRYGGRLSTRLFGQETVAALNYGSAEYFPKQMEDFLSGIAPEDRLGVALVRVRAEWPKHLAVSVPLAWRGMNQLRQAPFGNLLWVAVLVALFRGTKRNRAALATYSLGPFALLAIIALVSESQPRMNHGLLLPLAVGTAIAAVGLADRLTARWARPRGLLARPSP